MRVRVILLSAALCSLAVACGDSSDDSARAPATQPAPATRFTGPASGEYAGDGLRIILRRNGDTYRGSAVLGDLKFELRGTFDPDTGLSGTFDSNGKPFAWGAQVAGGDGLAFKTGDTEYRLVRDGQVAGGDDENPLARRPLRGNPLQKPGDADLDVSATYAQQTAPPASQPVPRDALRFTRLSVRDPAINNIEALSLLIPAGWKAEGGVLWFPDHSILASLIMKVTDPATGATLEFLPRQNFTWIEQPVVPMEPGTNYMGNLVLQPIHDVAHFVEVVYAPQALPHLRGVEPTTSDDLPQVAEAVAQVYGGQSQVRASRVRYEYQRDGKPWEEDVFVTLAFSDFPGSTIWGVHSACAFRAPRGELDKVAPLMSSSLNTVRLSLDWYAGYMHVQKLFMNRMNQGLRSAAAISETVTRNAEEIRQMYGESYKQAQASQDRISQGWSEAIRGVETYKNPFEDRPVQLPGGYKDAWVNSAGEYLLSNDTAYDPNVGDTREWRRMEQAK